MVDILLTNYQKRFNYFAKKKLPNNSQHIGNIYKAIRHSFFAGGKRLRPALIYSMAESIDINLEQVDSLALAIECIHTYSLIHDDLPAMDNDDYRRGQPACHKQFGEATAILAGDALNTLAFEYLSKNTTKPHKKMKQIQLLAECAGVNGMLAGQDIDLVCERSKNNINLSTVSKIHLQKTAKLIEFCLLATYLNKDNINLNKVKIISNAALSLGLFYQIQDDILDITQNSDILGKPCGSDINNKKLTYISLLGIDTAKDEAQKLATTVNSQLQTFFSPNKDYKATPLARIIDIIMRRNH